MATINVDEQMHRRMLDRGILTQEIFDKLVSDENKRKAVREKIAGKDFTKFSKTELIAIIEELR